MKNATRLLIPSLSLGFLVKTAVVSHALAFTVYVNPLDPANPVPFRDYNIDGALTGPNSNPAVQPYKNFFIPEFPAAGGLAVPYGSPSVVNFGDTQTVAGIGAVPANSVANSATFNGGPNSTVNYTFDLQNNVHIGGFTPSAADDAFDRFVVTGSLTGSVGYADNGSGGVEGFSTTKITFSSIKNLDAGPGDQVTSFLTTNPNNGLAALFIHAKVGTQDYNIYLNEIQDITAPNGDVLSISGYIEAVPEPGSMALLFGLGVTGAALLRRRKK